MPLYFTVLTTTEPYYREDDDLSEGLLKATAMCHVSRVNDILGKNPKSVSRLPRKICWISKDTRLLS